MIVSIIALSQKAYAEAARDIAEWLASAQRIAWLRREENARPS